MESFLTVFSSSLWNGSSKAAWKAEILCCCDCGLCLWFPCTWCQQWGLPVTPGLLLDTEVTPRTEWAQGILPASLGAEAELARFAGLTRFILEGSSKYSCCKGADVPCQ